MGWIVTRLRRRFLLMRAWMRYRRQRRRMIEENWETFYRKAEVNANERNAAERRIEAELDASYEVWKRSL